MKILNTRELKKEAGVKDWLIEKGNGFFDKIRDVFQSSDNINQENYAEEMIDEVRDGQFEEETVQGIGENPEYTQVEPTNILSGLTMAQKTVLNSIGTGGTVRIGYLTKKYNTYIVRNITPLYTYKAITTNNDIVVSNSLEAQGDFRAFIINHIVSAEPTEQQNFGE